MNTDNVATAASGTTTSTPTTVSSVLASAIDSGAAAVQPTVHTAASRRSLEIAAPPSPLQGYLEPNSRNDHNFFLSGFAFMLLAHPPMFSTQLQQPMSTLLWAARRPQHELLSSVRSKQGSNSDGSSSSSGGRTITSSSDSSNNMYGDSSSSSGGGDISSSSEVTDDGREGLPYTHHSERVLVQQEGGEELRTTFPEVLAKAALQLVNGSHDVIKIK